MIFTPLLLVAILTLVFPSGASAGTQADFGISIVDGSIRGFHIAVGEYFHVPEKEVIVIRERRIPDDEIPVILFIAQHAHVRPAVVIEYRLRGYSWTKVTLHFGLTPDIYYVPVREVHGPPYGKAYGHFRKRDRKEWNRIVLDDDDVVNLVNLRVISERYGYSPDEVIRLRSSGRDFVVINEEAHRGKGEKHDHGDRGHGKGHDKD